MSQTILIGFEIKVGSFPNKDTCELVEYSNRIIRCITDVGSDETHVGFAPFEEKIKRTDLARYLNITDNDTNVDNVLKTLINKPVEFQYAPRNGVLAVVGFKPVNSK